LNPPAFSFRPIHFAESEGDLPFLRELYASTRENEIAQAGWPKAQGDAFLLQQFEAQHRHYIAHYPRAKFDLILGGQGEPIGRLYLEEMDDEFRIIDISLRPESCGQGIGSQILQNILDQASAAGKAVRIHVEQSNPAMRLYGRLGFQKIEERGIYHLMEVAPPVGAAAASSPA
jgi:ribosomal protein S18 acetylase RimI-like enzyme